MLLQVLNLVETLGFGNVHGHLVGRSQGLGFFFANLEDIFQTFQGDRDNLRVADRQQITERPDASLLHQELDLLWRTTTRGVGNRPSCFLTNVKFCRGQQLNQRRDNVVFNDGLDLFLVAGGNVGNRPACFLANTLLGTGKKGQQARQGIVVDDKLRLQIVTSDNVPHGPQGRRLDGRRGVQQEFDQATADTGFNDGLDFVIGSVTEIGQGPAGIRQDFFVGREDELSQGWEGDAYHFKVGLRFATAKVGKSPRRVPKHGKFAVLLQLMQEWGHGTGLQHQITAGRRVTGNVSQGPDGLFADVVVGARQETDKNRDGTNFNDNLGMFRGSTGNVGQSPSRLELQGRVIFALQKFDKARHHTRVNDLLNRRILFDRKQATKLCGTFRLYGWIVSHDSLHHGGQLLQLGGRHVGPDTTRGRSSGIHHALIRGISRVHQHGGSRQTGRCTRGSLRRHLTTLGHAIFLFVFPNLHRGLFTRPTRLFCTNRPLETTLICFCRCTHGCWMYVFNEMNE
mmetsp:Transcript_5742/g.11447  ORF Transcript_5742/g.11447 Transcript_5742/m.11447 type:complete len:512 (-) Transcript_5742:106-1641(-)